MGALESHRCLAAVAALAAALVLVGCVPQGRPVVAERSHSKDDPRSATTRSGGVQTYLVRKGDTLYSIAWRFQLDHRRFAQANAVQPPYTIYPGQRLRLTQQITGRVRETQTARHSTRRSTTEPSPRRAAPSAPTVAPKPASNPRPSVQPGGSWRWPLPRQLATPFDGRGVDFQIASVQGAARRVAAAGAGQVVYAGNGLGGYERLIILKHSQDLLSAYSFDGKALVAERAAVKAGEPVADIEGTGRKPKQVHFEIRRKGKPIDPRSLLD